MIKPIIFTSIFLLASVTGEAMAVCVAAPGYARVTGDLAAFLVDKTACKANGSGWEWQEFHKLGGDLVDWKKGTGHPVDPPTKVGTWSATSGATPTVNYNYGPGASYTYSVWQSSAGLDFCKGSKLAVAGASLLNGQGACQ